MSGTFYKGLGFAVWKGGIWYVRRRYGTAPKRLAGALAAAALAGAIVVAQRRHDGDSG